MLNGIARFQRHDVAAEQVARINTDFLALTGDGDDLRVAVTAIGKSYYSGRLRIFPNSPSTGSISIR